MAEERRAYLRRITHDQTLEGIYSEERKQQWEAFSSDDRKKIKESKVFIGFVESSGLPADPFEHKNEDPPRPDIRAIIGGGPYYFELGEIVDQRVARAFDHSTNRRIATGCSFSQEEPLLKMLREKCITPYVTDGAPLDLLLHYSMQNPHTGMLKEFLKDCRTEIAVLIAKSRFARVWIYSDRYPRRVLWTNSIN